MVHKVVEAAELEIDEVKRKDAVTEKIAFIKICALVAAASEKKVEEEDWKTSSNENWVLYYVDDQIGIKVGSSPG